MAENQRSDIEFDRLRFLAKLPLILNSSLEPKRIIARALEELKKILSVQAATVFLYNSSSTLTFWALQGESAAQLEGKSMPVDKGIVGWVLSKRESVQIDDVSKDPRFFSQIDKEAGFKTKNMICAPLIVRGSELLGALQVINSAAEFSSRDVEFVEQYGTQLAVSIDNAKLHQEVVKRSRQLETLDKRKNEMISLIAHEFRTPLNLILGSADLLTSGAPVDSARGAQIASTLGNGVKRLTRLIGQIHETLYVSADTLKISKTAVGVVPLFKQIEERFRAPFKSRSVSFSLNIKEGVLSIDADSALLSIVLRNLISNALRFTPDGGAVTLEAKQSAGLVEIGVRDTGIGIEKAQIPLIFEKFYEVTPIMEHHSGEFEFRSAGLGLGLSAAQAILRAHGAELEVQSEVGKGSYFKFFLPAK